MTERTAELQHRFRLIRQTLSDRYSPNQAFAAASVAWLEAIQYACKQALIRVRSDPEYQIGTGEDEISKLLQAFHQEMCEHLNTEHEVALELSKHFRQVLYDITGYGGK